MNIPELILQDEKASFIVGVIPNNDEYHYKVSLNVKYLLKALNITIEDFMRLVPLMDMVIMQEKNK